MNDGSFGSKVVGAAKWSFLTQVLSKIISPITQLVLAHLLTPEIFGVVAITVMVTSFANMFSDAGFQKYLVQHEYSDDEDLGLSANVAFWTNLIVSLALWLLIALARDNLAILLGDPSVGLAIAVSCASLPLTAAVSVQTALYQRKFDFKQLFYSRIGSALLILVVAVPMAVLGFGYWSMIVATIASNVLLAIWLTAASDWRPSFAYNVQELKRMFSFSAWTLIEAFSIWVTSWMGAFIVGTMLDTYYLGLYRTSSSIVLSVTGIVSGAVTPVLYSGLSRLQDDKGAFYKLFYETQRYLGLLITPIALAIFVFRDFATGVFLGEQWLEASLFLGLYGAEQCVSLVLGTPCSEVYRALGKPRVSLLVQILYLCALVPLLIISARAGFPVFSVALPIGGMIAYCGVQQMVSWKVVKLSPLQMVRGQVWFYFVGILDAIVCSLLVNAFPAYASQIPIIILYIAIYAAGMLVAPNTRALVLKLLIRFGVTRHQGRIEETDLPIHDN